MQSILREDGFSFGFDPTKCFLCEGNCCIGESGYIWCTPKEIDDMANFLEIQRDEFLKNYTKKIKYRISLKEVEIENSFHCIFFDNSKKCCKIYPVRPKQCRTFPFWEHYKKNIEEVVKECPGIII